MLKTTQLGKSEATKAIGDQSEDTESKIPKRRYQSVATLKALKAIKAIKAIKDIS